MPIEIYNTKGELKSTIPGGETLFRPAHDRDQAVWLRGGEEGEGGRYAFGPRAEIQFTLAFTGLNIASTLRVGEAIEIDSGEMARGI